MKLFLEYNNLVETFAFSGVDVRKFLVRPWSGAAPGIAAAHLTEYVPTRHQPMIMLVILSKQSRGGIQQSAEPVKGRHLTEGRYLIVYRYDLVLFGVAPTWVLGLTLDRGKMPCLELVS